ncbi:indolepyruvate ferredoxin oxidoreductase subunit alpha, partial [bacterium]|nr:indolepyruvate ferredoxin oxidoreductase subunit alpha [bacterium]
MEITSNPSVMTKKKYLLGNHAVAYGLVEGEIDAAFAYPGTPSSEIMEKLIELSKEENFYVEWSINEKVAYENAYGCAISGRKAAVIMKHVGLNVASDSFITSAYTGIVGGLTVIVADDPFAHSSQNEQDTRRYIKFAKVPGFEPSSIQEAKDMASLSLRFSEKTELPVVVRLVTRISHGKSDVEIKKVKREKKNVKFEKNPGKFVMVPANARKRLKILNEKQKFTKEEIEKLPFNWIDRGEGKFGIVASGISYQYVREFLKENNLKIPVLKIGTYPLPEKKVKKFLKKVNELI